MCLKNCAEKIMLLNLANTFSDGEVKDGIIFTVLNLVRILFFVVHTN